MRILPSRCRSAGEGRAERRRSWRPSRCRFGGRTGGGAGVSVGSWVRTGDDEVGAGLGLGRRPAASGSRPLVADRVQGPDLHDVGAGVVEPRQTRAWLLGGQDEEPVQPDLVADDADVVVGCRPGDGRAARRRSRVTLSRPTAAGWVLVRPGRPRCRRCATPGRPVRRPRSWSGSASGLGATLPGVAATVPVVPGAGSGG